MKLITSFVWSNLALLMLVFFQGCGQQSEVLEAYRAGKRAALKSLEETHAATNLLTESKKDESAEARVRAKKAQDEAEAERDYALQPFLSVLPYYCNPFEYPAHIIHAAKACRPHLKRIYAHGTINWADLYGGHDPDDYGVRPGP